MGIAFEGPTIEKLVEEVRQARVQGTKDIQALKIEFSGLQEKVEAAPTQ